MKIAAFLIQFGIIITFFFGLDFYAFQAVKTVTADHSWGIALRVIYWGIHVGFYTGILFSIYLYTRKPNSVPRYAFNYVATTFLLLYLPKLFLIVPLLGEDVFRTLRYASQQVGLLPTPETLSAGAATGESISRSKFISMISLGIAGIPFAALIYGAVKTKYDFMVKRVTLALKNLPEAFNGLTITQISDFHTGSYDSFKAVERGIQMVNEQASDLIFFTGDIVNNKANELEDWWELFSTLKAPMGIFSILGNHDYGHYVRNWEPGGREKNFRELLSYQRKMGWRLLRNENVMLERDNQKLAVIGVENWSAGRFGKFGDLAKAKLGTDAAAVKLLLSHDPSHWDGEIRPLHPDINVTFSGHTHGFQMGIETANFKWSPVQYVYKQWAGLYQKAEQYLYVNRGFGFNAYSGRVGIKPEITVFELVRG